jgi:hypothetical protein
MKKNIDKILEFIENNQKEITFSIIKNHFDFINESTLVRNLNKLVNENKIKKISK